MHFIAKFALLKFPTISVITIAKFSLGLVKVIIIFDLLISLGQGH